MEKRDSLLGTAHLLFLRNLYINKTFTDDARRPDSLEHARV